MFQASFCWLCAVGTTGITSFKNTGLKTRVHVLDISHFSGYVRKLLLGALSSLVWPTRLVGMIAGHANLNSLISQLDIAVA